MKKELLMSDLPEIVESQTQANLPNSAGELLRRARETTGLHIAALAVMLKVPVKKLEALEGNRFDLLPDAVFVRALAASVCRTLKIDAAPILAQLPATSAPKLSYQGVGINEAFHSPGDTPGPSMWAQISRPAVLAGLALLLGALILIFFPTIKLGVLEVSSGITDSSLTTPATAAAQKPIDTDTQAGAASTASTPDRSEVLPYRSLQLASGNAVGASTAPAPVNVAPSVVAAVSDSKVAALGGSLGSGSPTLVISASPTSSSDVVVFTASADSWVEATDAKGQVVLRRMLAAGDTVGTVGSLPLKVVVGRANMTQVQIRGKGFDLTPVSKDNVARFEVR